MKYLLVTLLCGFILMGCNNSTGPKDVKVSVNGAFILNEGVWGKNNGSLSYYDTETGKIQNNIFEAVNGRGLGDVVQSMTLVDTLGFIVVNNSNTIEVISLNTWKSIKTIDMPGSPRYLVTADGKKGYISNLYANDVAIINLETFEVEKTINVGANPEQMAIVNNRLYVANSGLGNANTVSVIDISSDKNSGDIIVGDNPISVKVSDDDNLLVFCAGSYGDFNDPADDTNGGVYLVDPKSGSVTNSLIIKGHPSGTWVHSQTGYFMYDGNLVSYNVSTLSIGDTVLTGADYYNMGINPADGSLYMLDAKDYQQNGDLVIYNPDGTLKETLVVGLVPGEVVFSVK